MSAFAHKPWLRHYDPWVPHSIEFPRRPLYSLLQHAAAGFPHRPAAVCNGVELTFSQLKDRADRLAAAWHAEGIRKGDRIGIMLPNGLDYPVAFFAAMRLGAIVVNINPAFTQYELDRISAAAGLSLLVNQPIAATANPATLPHVPIDPEHDIALLQFTGGTTGPSKGAMLTHFNLYSNVIQNALWHSQTTRPGEERMLLVLPAFHIYGLVIGLLLGAWTATMLILVPKFDVNEVIDACRRHQPTIVPGVPTLYISLLNHPSAAGCGLNHVKRFHSGGAPLPVDVIERFERLTGRLLREGFGMTETSATACTTPLHAPRKPGSVGIPVTGTGFKIVDADDPNKELGVGQEGELCIRGPQVMAGYWNNPEETAHALRDGWMFSGDIARMDEDGFFYLVQRKKDMIAVSGFKVFPSEVEEVLFAHPSVREACVIGVPHAYRGESVKAFVVPRAGEAPSATALIEHCARHLAKFKVPSEIEFLDALPKTAVGKVLRRELRKLSS